MVSLTMTRSLALFVASVLAAGVGGKDVPMQKAIPPLMDPIPYVCSHGLLVPFQCSLAHYSFSLQQNTPGDYSPRVF